MSEETNNNVQPEVQTQEPEQPPVKEKKTFGKKNFLTKRKKQIKKLKKR